MTGMLLIYGESPKPNGGVRKLGIPVIVDRIIQQAIVQVISVKMKGKWEAKLH